MEFCMRLIYGSTALRRWFPDLPREPNDIDLLSPDTIAGADTHWDNRLSKFISNNEDMLYLDADKLLTLKISHLPWELKNNSWWKHLRDVTFMLKKGVQPDLSYLPTLHEIWSERYGSKKHINLNKPEAEFFTTKVKRYIPHEELHLRLTPTPAYLQFKCSDKVAFDSKKWATGKHEDKINCAVEESMVLALERNLTSGINGFKHLVTKCSTGDFNLFCILNAEDILNEIVNRRKQFITLSKELKQEQS